MFTECNGVEVEWGVDRASLDAVRIFGTGVEARDFTGEPINLPARRNETNVSDGS